jgi:uncharacterized protein YdhG (YjbR/CyaY superfamily)
VASKKTAKKASGGKGFTAEERAAMRERARELKSGNNEESDVVAKIAAMPPADRVIGERIHALVRKVAPDLAPRLWYGMPAYAKDGKVVCFFQGAHKFKTRYCTFGFSDQARLDEGELWPTGFAVRELNAAGEARIAELVRKAVR